MNGNHLEPLRRRRTCAVRVGASGIGGDNPIRIQSMTNTPTLDTEACVSQIKSIADAGADFVRLTAQGVSHAKNLADIRMRLHEDGYDVPLIADIHFNRAAAMESALHVSKIRINPGNFVDPARTFRKLEYTDEEYASELDRIEKALIPLLDICADHGTALRIGVNHGSLSDRIMSRYGDTPRGMTESAMEFMRVCRRHGFNDVVISVKASNVCIMVETMRMLAAAMDKEGMDYPLHLGVTEAGDGEDGRVKSAVGIGTLLAEGIGDTIRVSLSEDPADEIPVARRLVEHIERMTLKAPAGQRCARKTVPVVVGSDINPKQAEEGYRIVDVSGADALAHGRQALLDEHDQPAILKITYPASMTPDEVTVAAAVDFGSPLLDGLADGVWIVAPSLQEDAAKSLMFTILQSTRRRITKTEFIACPGCGRTLFDLQGVLAEVKAATGHIPGLKIAVMGCIVNGPGEMADADYGYVGAAKGHVSLYRGKECLEMNVPASEAIDRLISILKADGKYIPQPQ